MLFYFNASKPLQPKPFSWFNGLFGQNTTEKPPQKKTIPNVSPFQNKISLDRIYQPNAKNLELKLGFVETFDNALLHTYELTPNDYNSKPPSEKKFILRFNFDMTQIEEDLYYQTIEVGAMQVGLTVFTFRGIFDLNQSPKKLEDLVNDGISQVERLLQQGIKPKNILLDGKLFSGAIATLVAAYFHKRDIKVHLWVDRSYKKLTADNIVELSDRLSWKTNIPPPKENAHLWVADIKKAFLSIDAHYRDFTYVPVLGDRDQSNITPALYIEGHGHPVASLGKDNFFSRRELFYDPMADLSSQKLFEQAVKQHIK